MCMALVKTHIHRFSISFLIQIGGLCLEEINLLVERVNLKKYLDLILDFRIKNKIGNNLYGVHPFFMAVNEVTGRAFGVLIFNSNGQEYAFLPPYSLNYRTLGGILDIYIMEEESPEKLIQAYTSLIGLPYFPPYWSLGIIYFI